MKKTVNLLFGCIFAFSVSARADQVPGIKEVMDLLRANLEGVSQSQIEEAAISGLARELQPRVFIESATNHPTVESGPLSTRVFGNIAYLRVVRVDPGLRGRLAEGIKTLDLTNHLKGLILDLRFAEGDDYSAASSAASLFISQERPLLSWEGGASKSAANPEAITLPLAVLVNRDTRGAAEALGALLRDSQSGLLIGRRTAGLAVVYKKFALGNGRQLMIAGPRVGIPEKGPVAVDGLVPDIAVEIPAAEERLFYADPYRVLSPSAAGRPSISLSSVDEDDLAASSHRLNEAELVRMRREGINPLEAGSGEPASSRPRSESDLSREKKGGAVVPEPPRPRLLSDPILNRALDLLKALAVVRSKPV